MNLKREKINIKLVAIILIVSVLFQIIMPIILPAKSFATEDDDIIQGEIAKIKISSEAKSLNVGDKVQVEIEIEGTDIVTFYSYFDYDTNIFEELTKNDVVYTSGWANQGASKPTEKGFYIFGMANEQEPTGTKNKFVVLTINFTVKQAADMATISFNHITFSDTEDNQDENAAGGGKGYTFDLQVPKPENSYNIIYNANPINEQDTITEMPTPLTKVKNKGENYIIESAPKYQGYRFTGWNTKADGTGITYEAGSTYTQDAPLELYAQWKKQSTLTVNPNGGTWNGSTEIQPITQDEGTELDIPDPITPLVGNKITYNANGGEVSRLQDIQPLNFIGWTGATITNKKYTFGSTNETITANYEGQAITLPTATMAGSRFLGWYTELQGGTRINGAGETYTPEYTRPNQEITLFAQWEEQEYELTINPNGGTYNGATTEKRKYGGTVAVTDPTPPTGYTITLDKNDGTGTKITETQRLTFDRWIKTGQGSFDQMIYTFGEGDGTLTATYTRNPVNLGTSSRTGYTFDGWYTQAVDGAKIENPSAYPAEGDTTLYAHWTQKQFTLTFNPGTEGNLEETEKTVTYDELYGELPTPTRDGYEFNGWYDKTGKEIKAEDIVNMIEDTTLTAKWLGAAYTVNFDYEDGTGTVQSKQIRNEGIYGTLPNATKEGHTFVGWYTEDGNKIDENTIVNITSDITLQARYEINKYTVTFKNDDGTTIKTITANYGSTVEFDGQTPTKSNTPAGYEATFNGWTGSENLQNITSNTTVTATYTLTPIVYTITYENVKNSDISDTIKFPTSYTVEDLNIRLEKLPNQEKLIFDGWYTTNDENGKKVTSIDISKLGNITLYAKWREDKLYLKSEIYKIGENDIDNYEDEDIYLEKIMPETTVAQFIQNCESNGKITVINQDGEMLQDNDLVGTNMTIEVTRYDEKIILTAVVMGDLDGNGLVTVTDLSGINQAVLKTIELKDAIFKAADLDDNKKITVTDLSGENQKILKVIEFKYDKKTYQQQV